MSRWRLAALIAAALVVTGGIASAVVASRFRAGKTIAPKVEIEGVAVGGLTPADAVAKVRSEWAGARRKSLRFTALGDQWDLDTEALGIHADVTGAVARAESIGRRGGMAQTALALLRAQARPTRLRVPVTLDRDRLAEALKALAREVDRAPVDARVHLVGDGVEIAPERVGRKLDETRTAEAIARAATDVTATEVALVVATAEPRVKAADLQGFDAVLGEYSTPYDAGKENRSHNLKLGIGAVNEGLILPGQTFSLNAVLGPREPSRGWLDAPTFVNGDIVDTPGGGVCQIATTVYNAALLAGLEITERHHHSMPVHYVPPGRDATVSYGGADLKLLNDFPHPVLLMGWLGGGRLHVNVIGAAEDKVEVELTRSGVETVPRPVKETPDLTLQPGKKVVDKPGRDGRKATLTRVIKRGGQVVKTQVLHSDIYAPQPKVVRVGPPKPVPPGSPAAGAKPGASGAAGSGAKPPARPRAGHPKPPPPTDLD